MSIYYGTPTPKDVTPTITPTVTTTNTTNWYTFTVPIKYYVPTYSWITLDNFWYSTPYTPPEDPKETHRLGKLIQGGQRMLE